MFMTRSRPNLFALSAICIMLPLLTCHGESSCHPIKSYMANPSRSNDGHTLLITSSDGFCSCLTFAPGELGTVYHHPPQVKHTPMPLNSAGSPAASTPGQTPNYASIPPPMARQASSQGVAPSPSPFNTAQPASPARSISNASVYTQASAAPVPGQEVDPAQNDTPQVSAMPGLTASISGTSTVGGVPLYTPPQTPGYTAAVPAMTGLYPPSIPVASVEKREGDSQEERGRDKRRRIAPTPVSEPNTSAPPGAIAPPLLPTSQASEVEKPEDVFKQDAFAKPSEP